MRLLLALLGLAPVACAPPCTEPAPFRGSFRCPSEARANASITVLPSERQPTNLSLPAARCTVTVDAGTVSLALEVGVCTGTIPAGFSELEACTVPPLPPGRWSIAGFQLELPADGGTAIGCP